MSNYKSPIRVITTDFRSGEVDPLLAMRGDTGGLPSTAQSLQNMLVSQLGPVSRRPGTRNLAKLIAPSRVLAFEFDADERYVVALSNGRADIYSISGTLQDSVTGAPWTTATMWELTFVQKGDVMIIVHPTFQMQRLRRDGASVFVLEPVTFGTDTGLSVYNQPYFKYRPRTDRIKCDRTTPGSGIVTAEQTIFTADWVGIRLRIFNCEMVITGYTDSTHVTVSVKQNIKAELGIAPFRYVATSAVVEVTHALHGLSSGATVTIAGATDWPDIDPFQMNGARAITVIDEDHYSVVADDVAAESGDGGGPSITIATTEFTRQWTEQVWSTLRGWPGAIALHENRLWLGGSKELPTFLSGSAVGDYYDHNVRDGLDDESVQTLISTTNRIVHLLSAKQLQIFTEGAEAVVETQNGQPITPGSFKVLTHTSYGVSAVRPMLFDGATLFCQRNGKNIREMVYDYNTDMQVSAPISMLSNHMINGPRDIAVLMGTPSRGEQYAFIANANGTVAVFQSLRSEKLVAWTPMRMGFGFIYAVAAVGPSVFLVVREDDVYFLERFELDDTDIWLDHAKVFAGPASATWTLGTDYAGQTLDVMCRNNYLGRFDADGAGTITLPVAVPEAVIGYNYPVTIVPQPPDKDMNDGSMTGEIRRVVSTTIHYHNSVSATVNGQEQIHFNPFSDPAAQPTLASGKRRVRMLGYGRDPRFTISQSTPGPFTVLGLSMEVSL